MNSRETLLHVADWLGWQDEDLSYGLRNAFDALRLYDHWRENKNLGEMADEWEAKDRIAAVGYDPMQSGSFEHETTGADAAVKALRKSREILDSVAFVAKEGDTRKALKAINAII